MKPHNLLAAFLFIALAITAKAQQKRDELAQMEDVDRVSTNTIHKRDAHMMERREGRKYSRKQPKEVYGVKLSKQEWRKRVKEQSFDTKPVKKQPKSASRSKKSKRAKSSK